MPADISPSAKVWLITGCSSGFGSEITLAALARGDKVVATARDPRKLSALAAKGAHTLALDVTSSDDELKKVADAAVQAYGRIDILVNNAGFILQGTIEECSASEITHQFNTNVFGPIAVLRAFLPHMRSRRTGIVANLGSIGGWRGIPNAGMYAATKFAIAGISESLGHELEPFGIQVVCIEPGYFRTGFLNGGHRNKAKKEISDYAPITGPAAQALDDYNNNQPGDPVKGSKIIVEALTGGYEGKKLPSRLALGNDAVGFIDSVIVQRKRDLDEWADIVRTTDCDDVIAKA